MSLDIHLRISGASAEGTGIYIRENGSIKELTHAEWNEKFPDREPIIVKREDDTVYSANITHNLGKMADMAGLYQILWRPDENEIKHAHQLVDGLKAGLEKLRSDRAYYEQFNASNGWGVYDNLVEFVEGYLTACEKYPYAEVSVWR